MAETSGSLVDSVFQLVQQFAEVATTDPASAAMLASGAILTGFAMLVFGALTLGAVVDFFVSLVPTEGGGPPPR